MPRPELNLAAAPLSGLVTTATAPLAMDALIWLRDGCGLDYARVDPQGRILDMPAGPDRCGRDLGCAAETAAVCLAEQLEASAPDGCRLFRCPHGLRHCLVADAAGGWLLGPYAATEKDAAVAVAERPAGDRGPVEIPTLTPQRLERIVGLARTQGRPTLDALTRHLPGILFQLTLDADGQPRFTYLAGGTGFHEISGAAPPTQTVAWIHPDDLEALREALRTSAREGMPLRHEYRVLTRDQEIGWREMQAGPEVLPQGTIRWHGVITDSTGRKQLELGRIPGIGEPAGGAGGQGELAFCDPLTRLANRHLLMDRLARALAASKRSRQYGALLIFDLDRFKSINEAHGHDLGDRLLREVARRLRPMVRESDTVARLGGDEFAVVVENLGGRPEDAREFALRIADKLRAALGLPYRLDDGGPTLRATASIGVCLFLEHLEPIETLLKHADFALHQAKATGRDQTCFHSPLAARETPEVGGGRGRPDRDEQLIAMAIRLLEQRMQSPPSLAELAREIGTNARKLSGLFRDRFGLSAPKYFTELRLETGRRLLENSRIQIQLIAERVGFSNAGDFTRAFRRRYGITPRAYRRRPTLPDSDA